MVFVFCNSTFCHSQNPRSHRSSVFPPRCGRSRRGHPEDPGLTAHPPRSGQGRRAGTAAATRQCPAFTAASANHRPAPPGPARRRRPRLGPERSRPPGGHLRPSRGRACRAAGAPRPEEGARGAGAAPSPRDPGRARRAGRTAPSARTRRCPFKRSLLPGPSAASAAPPRGAATSGLPGWRRRRPLGQLPVPAGRPPGCERGAPPGRAGGGPSGPRESPAPVRPATARPRLAAAGPGRRGRHAGHGRFARGAAPRARARFGPAPPPARARGRGAGEPANQRRPCRDRLRSPGWGSARGRGELRGGRGAAGRRGEAGGRARPGAGRAAVRPRVRSPEDVSGTSAAGRAAGGA